MVERRDEDVLSQVLGLLAVADDPRAEVVDGGVMVGVEALEGVAAAGTTGRREGIAQRKMRSWLHQVSTLSLLLTVRPATV